MEHTPKSKMHSLADDARGGLVSAIALLPFVLAFGANSVLGICVSTAGAVIAGLLTAVWPGRAPVLAGPTCLVFLIFSTAAQHTSLGAAMLAAMLAGGLVIAASFFHVDRLSADVPAPIRAGFTMGLAFVMTVLQVTYYFGLGAQGANVVEMITSIVRLGFHANWRTVLYGTIVLVTMIAYPRAFRKLNRTVPAAFVCLVLTLLLNLWLNPAQEANILPEIGALSFDPLRDAVWRQSLSWKMLPSILLTALGLAAAIVFGYPFSRKQTPQEQKNGLLLLGASTLFAPLAGGMASSAADKRRGTGRLAPVFYACFLPLMLWLPRGVLVRVPLSALAVILIATMWYAVDWKAVHLAFQGRVALRIVAFFAMLAATILLDVALSALLLAILAIAAFLHARRVGTTADISV